MFGAQVGPDDAVSNLSKWPKKVLGWDVPAWLTPPAADEWGFWIGAALFVVAVLSFAIWGRARVTRIRATPLPPSKPFASGLHVSQMGVDARRLDAELILNVWVKFFNATGDEIWIGSVDGSAKLINGTEAVDLRPAAIEQRFKKDRIADRATGIVEIQQPLPRVIADRVLAIKDGGKVEFDFSRLDIVATSGTDPAVTARLPLWNRMEVFGDSAKPSASQIITGTIAPITLKAATLDSTGIVGPNAKPFVFVRLFYDAKENRLTVVSRERTRSVDVSIDRKVGVVWEHVGFPAPHIIYISWDDIGPTRIETESNASVSVSLIQEGKDYVRLQCSPSVSLSTGSPPSSGEIAIKVHRQSHPKSA